MSILKSHIQPRSASFQQNQQAMNELVQQLQTYQAQSLKEGEEKYQQRHHAAGKLLARERVNLLLDQDSPFLELMPLAGLDQSGSEVGASMVAGIGLVNGVETLVNASVPTIKGGAMHEYTILKGQRLDVIAMENKLPLVFLTESAGADLSQQSKVFTIGGGAFRELARRSKAGIPSLSVVFGACVAGGAYIPGMSDYVVMVKNQAQAFLAAPSLVRMATGEIADIEELGGAEMHSRKSGLSDYLAEDEYDAIRQAREWLKAYTHPQFEPTKIVKEPLYSSDELLGIVSADVRIPFDAREVIARIVDGSEFTEFKPLYGETLVTGLAQIHGYPVGILANNGVLFSESANKGAHFIQLCNKQNIPLIFMQNITGFMVGTQYEQEGIIKNGAKLVNALSSSEVPAITLLMGASYGAGNFGMCGRSYQPRFLFSWPNTRLALMGPDQLVGVLNMIQSQFNKNSEPDKVAAIQEKMKAQIETESKAWYGSAKLWDDGVIDPRDTRHVLGICLSVVNHAGIKGSDSFGVFRM